MNTEGTRKWSKAASYLLNVRDADLNRLCETGSAIQRNTPFDAITSYLKTEVENRSSESFVLTPFGSRVTGVANDESADIDLMIRLAGRGSPFERKKKAFAITVAWAEAKSGVEILEKFCDAFYLLRVSMAAPWKLTMDLTFGNSYVVDNSQLNKFVFQSQPLARKLYFVLKAWKKLADVTDDFHHHVLIILIVFFMQTRKYFPTIRSLLIGPQKKRDDIYTVIYNTKFKTDVTPDPIPLNLLDFMRNFFEYWSRFDWTWHGISVFEGTIVSKTSFVFIKGDRPIPAMTISDYFDQGRNVAGRMSVSDCDKFTAACREAVEVLKQRVAI